MARKQSIQPGRFCRECEHYYACSAQCGGLLHNTDATHCANFANISAYQEEIERLRLVVDEQDLALQKAENDLNTSRQAKWISVEEMLPEPKLAVLGYGTRSKRYGEPDPFPMEHVVYTRGEDEGWFTFWNSEHVAVTHWMPLPEQPKEEPPLGGNSDDFVHGNHG